MYTPLTKLYGTAVSTVQAKIGSLLDSVHLDRVRNWFQPVSVVEGADDTDPSASSTSSDWLSSLGSIAIVVQIGVSLLLMFFASLVANHLIFMPWQVRLFAFLFVYMGMGVYPVLTIGIPAYYILNALFNAYHNYNLPKGLTPAEKFARTKSLLPAIRGLLPLSTWKTDSLWKFETLLFPFKYKSIRMLSANEYTTAQPAVTPAEIKYNNKRMEYEQYCAQLVPGYNKLITTGFGKALKLAYDTHMMNLNYSPVTLTPKPVVASVASKSTSVTAATVAPVAATVAPVAPVVPVVPPVVPPVVTAAPVTVAPVVRPKTPLASPTGSQSKPELSQFSDTNPLFKGKINLK